MRKNMPFVSIVVCTCNGENKIENALDSLLFQDYPKNKYEILVVDDCSIDNTKKVVSEYPVKLIKHKENKGLAAARNTGLKYSKGEIYFCFDDDCVAEKNWLNELVSVYNKKKDAAGVCGKIISENKGLVENFMQEIGYGAPAAKGFSKSKNPLYRFFIYILDMAGFGKNKKISNTIQVSSIHGANSSFPRKLLEEVGGWDENFRLAQDTEICERISKKFKNKKFYYNPAAKILHKHQIKFFNFIKKIYLKGEATLRVYRKYKKILPIFPFPIFTLLVFLALIFYNPFYAVLSLVIVPQSLYFWWLIKFFRKLKPSYLLCPYMQMLLESATILGIIRGVIRIKTNKK